MPFPAMRSAIISGANGGLVTLITEPGFLAKNEKPQDSTPRIVIPALGPLVGDLPDRKLCLVRALKAYLERNKEPEVRHGRTPLFLNPKKPESNISPAHISTWIRKLVQNAHEHAGVEHVHLAKGSAHDVWKFSACWAAFNGAPFDQIMQARLCKLEEPDYLYQLLSQSNGDSSQRVVCSVPHCGSPNSHPAPGASSDEEEGLHHAVPLLPSGD